MAAGRGRLARPRPDARRPRDHLRRRTPTAIDAGLVADRGRAGRRRLRLRAGDEDIHTAVERRLTELVGDAGRRLHTARSRNDQVITDTLLLPARRAARPSAARCATSPRRCSRQAEAHVDTLLPGYTHCQRAQPVRLAHHLLAYVWMLDRDRTRLGHAIAATRRVPAGLRARSSGVGFPIDRAAVARGARLRARPTPNSLDAVGSRDALVDYLHFAAQLGVTSRGSAPRS